MKARREKELSEKVKAVYVGRTGLFWILVASVASAKALKVSGATAAIHANELLVCAAATLAFIHLQKSRIRHVRLQGRQPGSRQGSKYIE